MPQTNLTFLRPLRRSFVKGLLSSTSFLIFGKAFQADTAHAAHSLKHYQPKFFSPAEYDFLIAAAERIYPEDQYGPGAKTLGVPEFIDRQMDTPYGHGSNWYMSGPFVQGPANLGYQLPYNPRDLYRIGLKYLNTYVHQEHGKSFPQLTGKEQDNILIALEGGSISLGDIPGRIFFEQLRSNILEGVFSDPIYGGNKNLGGWVTIGFPGARADFMDWVDQNGARYPLGPVSISGETA
ncbi:gluconate 2-dehydrogenase subunit 3 family protein [Swingsia samuiensis]|uniref:Gluconate 2-dehydrogenase subunit 3 family protein n=1 Tax=Swingsia samuiensis TaxID=1293412 RepID=A0A4Y6UGR9_9PROT|nr:gluconate 2-dehydrogenase subunit 3 family protein [Swingsia samuiensis]QDH16772.1 gluconate 2-dehydrogenase subunit 3 family protein [Swingsia samuiensis]